MARFDESVGPWNEALTQALVQVPSINTGYMPTGNETPAAEMLKARYAAEEAQIVVTDLRMAGVSGQAGSLPDIVYAVRPFVFYSHHVRRPAA